MRGKLLAWRSTLFVARYERQRLQLQRVGVDADSKSISLHPCSVALDAASGPLPNNAQLVAAREVEDEDLAIRYPLLVFQSREADAAPPAKRKPIALHRRRRSLRASSDFEATVVASTAGEPRRLFFFMLCESKDSQGGDGTIHARFLDTLDVPDGAKTEPAPSAADDDTPELQVFVTDGPHVLLFDRCSQMATVLKRGAGGSIECRLGFHTWRKQVRLGGESNGAQTGAATRVTSCTYVSETLSTNAHLLIRSLISASTLSESEESYTWSVLPVDDQRVDHPADEVTGPCHYLPTFSALGDEDDHASSSGTEQVTCCCFISEASDWDCAADASECAGEVMAWMEQTPPRPKCVELAVSTLLVVSTSSNSVYVYANGVLLASFVLPAAPAEISCISEDDIGQRYVLAVSCEDAARSFFLLGFSSNIARASMELLLSFIHVGYGLFGEFCCFQASSTSTPTQVLLLNDVYSGAQGRGSGDIGTGEGGKDAEHDIDAQLVKRSVLITQKLVAEEIKLSCYRLRLREQKKNPKGKKRTRGKAAQAKESFQYIERTQKASSHGKHQDEEGDSSGDYVETSTSASHAQLGKLEASLASRLDSGLLQLERMQLVMDDKRALMQQLNQLVVQQWCQAALKAGMADDKCPDVVSLLSRRKATSDSSDNWTRLRMETIVNAPLGTSPITSTAVGGSNDVDMGTEDQARSPAPSDVVLESQVSLKVFRVTEYVSSSSLVRVEVVLWNHSENTLENVFVTLASPGDGQAVTQGWTCSSSVVKTFSTSKDSPSSGQAVGEAHFQLELQFEPTFKFLRTRDPLEATLWLHWSSSVNSSRTGKLSGTWCPSARAFGITSVSFTPGDLLNEAALSVRRGDRGVSDSSPFAEREREQLLFVSTGTNLVSWMRGHRQPTNDGPGHSPFLQPVVVRPTFTLADLVVGKREAALYELSRVLAGLPTDVYLMRSPFGHSHLKTVQSVLRNMRLEILGIQRRGIDITSCDTVNAVTPVTETSKGSKKGKRSDSGTAIPEAVGFASFANQRTMQRYTDLQMLQLLQTLQKRVNFHTMWFDSAPAASS